MSGKEEASQVDFSQFWTRLSRPPGGGDSIWHLHLRQRFNPMTDEVEPIVYDEDEVMQDAVFDECGFAEIFGEEAAAAFAQCNHFEGNPPQTDEAKQALSNAIETIRRIVGVEPDVILQSKSNARIEDV